MNRLSVTLLIFLLAAATHTAPQTATAEQKPGNATYDLGRCEVINRAILAVISDYYDPSRIDPTRMFRASLDILEKMIAELLVRYDDAAKKVDVYVGDKRLTVNLADLDTPWRLSRRLGDLMTFINKNLSREDYDFQEIEFATANAMLSTLDPHSNALPPEAYEDLRMGIEGEFGGLGIKITTDRRPPCDGKLTVVEVFDNTPAKKVGLKPGDEILRINGESTVNITTAEAASRLRGKPGSKVTLELRRSDGSQKTLDLFRELIPIESVSWKLLDGKVGYIRLEAFQGNSDAEFERALGKLHEQKMKGLVLDLRGNPGGLLDVAIKIADLFLDSGTIVATAGRTVKDESVHDATVQGTEPLYPLVVLIDSSSASAAEILAGALGNHARALLVGETTFGKGSVQVPFPLKGGGAIKLTSAQYLTPGNISIQAVGVAPDIAFIQRSVDKKEMDLIPSESRFSEADLESHLTRPNERARRDRARILQGEMFVPAAERKAERASFERCYIDEPDRMSFRGRYEQEFARRLIAATDGISTEELMIEARELIAADNRVQDEALIKALGKLNVDWADPPAGSAKPSDKPPIDAKITATAKIVGKPVPGGALKLRVEVKNGSNATIYRLEGVTKSPSELLEGHELVFGKLAPGAKKVWTAPIEIPLLASARVDEVSVDFTSGAGPVPGATSVIVEIPERPQPRLAYGWQVQDLGNGDGVVSPGEEALLYMSIKNVGHGASIDADADLSAKPGVDVVQGRFHIGKLAPGATTTGTFRLRVLDKFPASHAELHLSVDDAIPGKIPFSRSLLDFDLDLSVAQAANAAKPASGSVTVAKNDGASLFEAPDAKTPRVIGKAPSQAAFAVAARSADWFKVDLGGARSAWIAAADVKPGGKPKPVYEQTLAEPPIITIDGPLVRQTKEEQFQLTGSAKHPEFVRDVMVFSGNDKLLYLPNPKQGSSEPLKFEVKVPLKPGPNQITVIARRSHKIISSETVFVRRIEQPKKEEAKAAATTTTK